MNMESTEPTRFSKSDITEFLDLIEDSGYVFYPNVRQIVTDLNEGRKPLTIIYPHSRMGFRKIKQINKLNEEFKEWKKNNLIN